MNAETVQVLAALAMDLPVKSVELVNRGDERDRGRCVTGVHIYFANDHMISVQWHAGCASSIGRGEEGEPTFEVAAFLPDGSFINLPGVALAPAAGWCNATEVIEHARNISARECL